MSQNPKPQNQVTHKTRDIVTQPRLNYGEMDVYGYGGCGTHQNTSNTSNTSIHIHHITMASTLKDRRDIFYIITTFSMYLVTHFSPLVINLSLFTTSRERTPSLSDEHTWLITLDLYDYCYLKIKTPCWSYTY